MPIRSHCCLATVLTALMGACFDDPEILDGETESSDSAGDTRLRVFVTSTKFPGDLTMQGTGTASDNADQLCASAASSLGGDWVAWLSADGSSALERVRGDGPWYLADAQTLVFADRAALAGTPAVAIDMHPDGTRFEADPDNIDNGVWTGSIVGGNASGSDCAGWTTRNAMGTFGRLIATDEIWTNSSTLACNVPARLYCFEQ